MTDLPAPPASLPALSRWERIADELFFIDYELGFPLEAVNEARKHWPEVRGQFLEELRAAAINPARAVDEDNAIPLFAIFLAGEMRDRAFQAPIIDLLRLPADTIEALIGGAITEGLGRILASVNDGDLKPLLDLAQDPDPDIFIRLAAVDALIIRVMEGDADAADVLRQVFAITQVAAAVLRGQPRARADVFDRSLEDMFFNLLVSDLADLGATQYWPVVEQWHRDGLIDPQHSAIEDIRTQMFASLAARVANMHKPHYVRDTVQELAWWACFHEPEEGDLHDAGINRHGEEFVEPFVREAPKIGRNDPCPCGSGKKFKKCCGADL